MRLDSGLVAGHGKQNLGDAMPDIVPDDIPQEQHGDEHSDSREDKEAPFQAASIERAVDKPADGGNGPVKDNGGAPREHADQKT